MMTREVTKTTIKVGKMEVKDGKLVAVELPDEIIVGNVKVEKAQRMMDKKYAGESVTVFAVEPETKIYEMPVSEFIKHATIKEPEENQ